jgi:hypothetical protein
MALIPARRSGFGCSVVLKAGPGDGKTYTAALVASYLADSCSDQLVVSTPNGVKVDRRIEGRIGVIETENRGREYCEGRPFWYLIEEPENCSPEAFGRALEACRKRGCQVVIIDSYTDEWRGKDGCLERAGHEFQKWNEVKEAHWNLLSAILAYPGFVILTLRVKEKFAMAPGSNGRLQVQNLGFQAEQEKFIEYRFPIVIEMDCEEAVVTKTAADTLQRGQKFKRPGKELAQAIFDWTASSVEGKTSFEIIRDNIERCSAVTMAELEKQKGEGLALDNVIAQISNNSENLTEREIGRLRDHFKAKRKELTTAAARENAVTTGQK